MMSPGPARGTISSARGRASGERGTGGIGDEISGVKFGVEGLSMETARCGGGDSGGAKAGEWRRKRLIKCIFGSCTDGRGKWERQMIG